MDYIDMDNGGNHSHVCHFPVLCLELFRELLSPLKRIYLAPGPTMDKYTGRKGQKVYLLGKSVQGKHGLRWESCSIIISRDLTRREQLVGVTHELMRVWDANERRIPRPMTEISLRLAAAHFVNGHPRFMNALHKQYSRNEIK